MNLIPALWKILWDVWNVRMLVLLSLTLQIILFVFGKRRKNMASQWINVVVWLAYITADSVATVALGKLSYAQTNIPNPNNALQALWAPLLLLHLGGPDTITAYSLEDNQLWIRHFLGMGIQAIVAIYVIVMSWRHFWFSFMLILTFVAGIIKYGERTWALKLACHDKSGYILPFYSLAADSIKKEERYKNVLIMAHMMVKEFKKYIENYDIGRFSFTVRRANSEATNSMAKMNRNDDTYSKDVLEAEMGLMYDLLYTKAPITFSKRGCIFRSMSFMCTVSVLVGLFRLIAMEAKWNEQQYSMVDIVITGVLLVGALALEIYAVILLLFSDWAMLWLIKCGRGKWAIRLWQKFPWFFEKKKWSKKMGQIDLFGEEDKRPKWSRILGRLGIQDYKFNRYMHSIPPTLYPVILKFISAAATDNSINLGSLEVFFASTTFGIQMVIMYIITDICCRCDDTCTSENSANSCGHDDDKETCKNLSHYMMYLLLTCRSLLPVVVSDSELKDFIDQARVWFSVMKSKAREEGRESSPSDMIKHFIAGARHHYQEKVERVQDRQGAKLGLVEAMDFFYEYVIIELVDKDNEEVKWEKLKIAWLAMLCYAAISSPNNYHLQQLKGGGELLNLVWFLIPQSHIFCGVDTFTLNGFFNKYFH
ncbi:hypothetical protein HYC85_003566 [Camellia sinensis]|uniref:DUF4220 domain-containing protein n=1 Tax=Camellia sinensis TaxID=4442 RepID=A0A7J7HVT3_CAMSI|nr:hypothetical protein HYC85_003566 [Camellia sinensis]